MTNTQLYDIERLQGLLDENISKFDDKKRFINPRTVENFLVHFYSFKDKTKKDQIYANLSDFLEILSTMEFEDLTPQAGASLYDRYIYIRLRITIIFTKGLVFMLNGLIYWE